MTIKTRSRTAPSTSSQVSDRGIGIAKAKRLSVPSAPTVRNITVPSKVRRIIVRNKSLSNVVRINFNDDLNSDYWELPVGGDPLVIDITDSVQINASAIGSGGAIVEAIFLG